MIERDIQDTEYEALPEFDKLFLSPECFLNWKLETLVARERLLSSEVSIVAMLYLLVDLFPNLTICRGATFGQPFGEKGDFFVGDIQSARNYLLFDYRQEPRHQPVLITAKLGTLLQLVQDNKITLLYDFPRNHRRFINCGAINIQQLKNQKNENILDFFSLSKPPKNKLDKGLFGSFNRAVVRHTMKKFMKSVIVRHAKN